MKISKGTKPRAQKVVIYGSEGIGKTTLAAQFPEPLFIDTEGGTSQLDVMRLDEINSWDDLLTNVNEVAFSQGICQTLVIDTADWAEAMCIRHICNEKNVNGIEDIGYGKGYVYVADEFHKLLDALDLCISQGINVVITAHGKLRKFEQPDESGAYDRWEMKLSRQTAPMLKEWCDMLLFCNYKTIVVNDDKGVSKAKGGKRVIYTSHHPCWDAKNRHGLEDEISMEYKNIAHLIPAVVTKTVQEEILDMCTADGITEEQMLSAIKSRGKCTDANSISECDTDICSKWVIPYYNKLKTIINGGN